MSEWLPEMRAKSVTYAKIHSFAFSYDFYTLGYMLFCKFSQYHVNWKHLDACKDHFGSKVQVKKNNTIIGQINEMENGICFFPNSFASCTSCLVQNKKDE